MVTSYFLLALISIAIIIAAVILGKKLRDFKDSKDLNKTKDSESNESDN